MTVLRNNMVLMQFAPNIPGEAQAMVMLSLEKSLRSITGLEIEVFKETMGDDSKLRVKMTPDERAKL